MQCYIKLLILIVFFHFPGVALDEDLEREPNVPHTLTVVYRIESIGPHADKFFDPLQNRWIYQTLAKLLKRTDLSRRERLDALSLKITEHLWSNGVVKDGVFAVLAEGPPNFLSCHFIAADNHEKFRGPKSKIALSHKLLKREIEQYMAEDLQLENDHGREYTAEDHQKALQEKAQKKKDKRARQKAKNITKQEPDAAEQKMAAPPEPKAVEGIPEEVRLSRQADIAKLLQPRKFTRADLMILAGVRQRERAQEIAREESRRLRQASNLP